MTEKQLDRKINKLKAKEINRIKKEIKKIMLGPLRCDFDKLEIFRKQLNNLNWSAIPYKKTKRIFKTSKCDFNPLTGLGHSYDWYELTKVIKGKLVVNTYRYSRTTNKHIDRVKSLITDLGLKFIEVQAPRGLQDLDNALAYTIREYQEELLKVKHSRDKKATWKLKNLKKNLKNLALLGVKPTKKLMLLSAQSALKDRNAKLLRKREVTRIERTRVKEILDEYTPALVSLEALDI